jgi:hypothetical protein
MNDFFAEIQELFGLIYFRGLSNDLYNNEVYFSMSLFLFLFTFIWIVAYYYIIKSPKWGTILRWSLWVFIGCIINFITSYLIAYNEMYSYYVVELNEDLPYSNEFIGVGLSNFITSLILSIIYSAMIKWKSTNASKIPF